MDTSEMPMYQPGDYATCPYLLPCGICSKTNQYCPLRGWRINDQPNIVYCNKVDNKPGVQNGCN